MPSLPPGLLVAIAGAAILVALAQLLAAAWTRASRRRKILGRVARAGAGEAEAARHLEALGYEIVGAQVAAEYAVGIDDEQVTACVRADYLVRRGGEVFVVEVKTGAVAPRIETVATRRQLLEYRVAFDVDGVLLLDADAGRLRAITFPRLETRAPARSHALAWAVALAVVVATVIVLRAAAL